MPTKKGQLLLNSILIVDDNEESLEYYVKLMKKRTKAEIISTPNPIEAIKLANKYFFDIVIIDATMTLDGTQFYGLEVYRKLIRRYGASSLLVYSQVIRNEYLKSLHEEFNFIEKEEVPNKFIDKIVKKIESMRAKQSCFIAMPFSKKFNLLYGEIRKGIIQSKYRCIRVDEQEFTKDITDKMIMEIEEAKIVIFVATEKNPNAYYECGYAVALKKEVITLIDKYENLAFDIRNHHALEYGHETKRLVQKLCSKLTGITDVNKR